MKFVLSIVLVLFGGILLGSEGVDTGPAKPADVPAPRPPPPPPPPANLPAQVVPTPDPANTAALAPNITQPKTDTNAVTAAPTTVAPAPTTQHPIVNSLASALCKRCTCSEPNKKVDCSGLKMTEWLTADELDTLVYGDIKFTEISLNNNELTSIPVFPAIPNLTKINLQHNKITKINDSAFSELTLLEYLDLSNNMLATKELTPTAFRGKYSPVNYEPLRNLRELNLSANDLHSLDPDLFEHFPVLDSLDLSYNSFKLIDTRTETAVANTLTLKKLDMSHMQLTTLPSYIFHAYRDLEKLSLNGNFFKTIPEALGHATTVKYLSLDDNLFTELDGQNVFPILEKLEELNLSYCSGLVKIGQGAFSQLKNLKRLRMTNNPILTHIHGNAFSLPVGNAVFFNYPPVEELLLHNNNLSVLPKALLERWDNVAIIDLRNNPWQCDCENDFVVDILFTQIIKNNPTLVADVNCTTPDAWAKQGIKTIHDKKVNLRCADLYGNHPENDGSVLVGMLIGVLVGIPLALFMLLLYRRGCFGLMGRSDPAAYNRAFYSKTSQDDYSI